MVDKMQLLSGEATTRVERVEVNQDKLAEMLAALPVLEAEVVDTGLTPTAPGQMPSLPSTAAQPSPTRKGVCNMLDKSVDCVNPPVITSADHKSLETKISQLPKIGIIGSYESSNVEQGGEGVANFEATPSDTTGQGPQKIFDKGPFSAPPTSSIPTTRP
jgi:hypothetical protein